ncbi:MAG: WxL domain-containing protein [Acidimicrobiales bacterium]
MKMLTRQLRKVVVPLLVIPAVTVGVAVGAILAASTPAAATTCGSAITASGGPPATASCTDTGTITVTGSTLTLTAPGSLAWAATLNGTNQSVVDINSGDQSFTVDDNTGSGSGWNVSVSATTFTNGTHTLSDTGTLSMNGSTSSATASTAPTASCVNSGACLVPTDNTTYPVAITTAASTPTASKVYSSAASSGMGDVSIGSVGWWVQLPGSAYAGSYTSTVTFNITSGP